jgi:hypothetical protein
MASSLLRMKSVKLQFCWELEMESLNEGMPQTIYTSTTFKSKFTFLHMCNLKHCHVTLTCQES